MKIFILNSGSSSIKYQLIQMPEKKVLAKGIVEKIGLDGSAVIHKSGNGEKRIEKKIKNHTEGIKTVLEILTDFEVGSLKHINEIEAVGHRVVHGGEDFSGSVLIDGKVIEALEKNIALAPLHNPPNLEGIYSINKLLPEVPQVGVFDTAFHQTMPPHSYMYAIPYRLYEKHKIRRYGFHGTSHKYISQRACQISGIDYKNSKIITCHLGNGSSVAAIKNGLSVDTSMGLTPNEGLIMGTRTGDIDAGAILFIQDKERYDLNGMNKLINKESGLYGISGVSPDMRELEEAADNGNDRAKLALDMFHYRIRKYIGAYAAALGGIDILVFAGGIGENSDATRKAVCKDLDFLGLELDDSINNGLRGQEKIISTASSKVKVIVVPTDEEMAIAMETERIIQDKVST